MADEVHVVFGAKIDQLIAGVAGVKEALGQVREQAARVTDGAKSMLEVLGVSLSVAGLVEYINKITELGETYEHIGQRLGLGTQAVVEFAGMARLTGTDVESLAMSVERMSLNLQRARSNSLDPAAQGLKVLGLNAAEFLKLDTEARFAKLAEVVGEFNPSLNLTNALMTIGGRTVANMIPILREGAEGFRRYQENIRAASEGLAAATPGMAETNTKIGLLSLSLQSLGARIFTVLKPAIDLAIESMTRWLQSIDSKTIVGAVDTIGNALITIYESVSTFFINLNAQWQLFKIGMGEAGTVASLGAAIVARDYAGIATAIKQLYTGAAGDAQKVLQDQADRLATVGTQAATARAKLQGFVDTLKTLKAADVEKDGKNAAGMNLNPGAAIGAAAAGLEAQIALLKQGLERQKLIYQANVDTFGTSQSQKTQLTLAATNEEYQAELRLTQQLAQLYAGQPKEYAAMKARIVQLESQHETEILRIQLEGIKAQKAAYDEFFGALQSSFNGQLRGLLAGTTSFKDAFRTILGDMIIYFIQAIERMVFNWAAGQLAILTSTETTEAAKAAAVASGTGAQIAAQLPLILKNIAASVGQVFAGVSAFLAPAIGPAAPAAAAGVAAGVEAGAIALIGSAEQGAYQVQGGLWQLHDNETVLPAPAAQAFRDMAEGGGSLGGGGTMNVYAMDARSFASYVKDNAAMINKILSGKAALTA